MTPTDHGAPAGQRGEGKATSPASGRRQTSAAGSGEGGGGPAADASTAESAGTGTSTGGAGAGAPAGAAAGRGGRRRSDGEDEVRVNDRVRVLIGPAPGQWPFRVAVPTLDAVAEALEAEPDITILRRIDARPPVRAGATFDAGGPALLAAEMPVARANALKRHLHLVVEADTPLQPAGWGPAIDVSLSPSAVLPLAATLPDAAPPFYGPPLAITLTVTDPDGQPAEGAVVTAFARRGPAVGITDAKGRVELTVLEHTPESIRSLSVAPARDHWSRCIVEPRLDPAQPNTVVVERLDGTFAAYPDRELEGWGLRAMRIDQLLPGLRGRGAKIAFVDSGAATSAHPDLRSPAAGFDLLAGNATGWKDDVLAHGTHCLGIVAAASTGAGIRGIAPEADVIVLKVLPGGRCSTLIEAIDRCIDEQVDVINLDLSTAGPSALVERRLQQARRLGIACIAAAGNTAGPVAYPASSPAVLAVAAVGRIGEFPHDSHHALQPAPGVPIDPDGFFAARLSAHGWEIDVCGPGVGVVSTVPPDGYAAWDGTSAAAAHVSGLATLLLAHHPDFTGAFQARTAARVDRLFDILRRSARPLALGDPGRTGAGLPDALVAFGDVLAPVAPGVIPPPVAMIDLTSPLDQLASLLHQAGIVNGNDGGNGAGKGDRQARGGKDAAAGRAEAALAELRETLERAGIWRGGES